MSQFGALVGGLWGDAGQNFADEQGGADKVFGTKPDVAPFTPVDLGAETGTAVGANLANYDSISALLNQIIPGFTDMLAQGSANTQSLLKGEIPQDVQDQVMRSTAFQSLMGGFSGTDMGRALTARDLGTTSLSLTQIGTNAAQQWASLAEEAYSPFTISTGQQAGVTAANNAGLQAQQQFQFNVDAAPDPGAAGIFNVDAALGQQMLSFGMGAAGGAMGGGSTAAGGSAAVAPSASTQWQLYGGTGSAPAYQYNPSTGQFGQVPQATGAWSDRRIKTNIVQTGVSPDGHKIYNFNYRFGGVTHDTTFSGVMADEVREIKPEAVYIGDDGFDRVDYNKIDVEFRMVDKELALEFA